MELECHGRTIPSWVSGFPSIATGFFLLRKVSGSSEGTTGRAVFISIEVRETPIFFFTYERFLTHGRHRLQTITVVKIKQKYIYPETQYCSVQCPSKLLLYRTIYFFSGKSIDLNY
jgi:hypothetical protein